MSERLKNTNISNEEVIDDLTKDLQFALKTEDKDNVIEPDNKANTSHSSDNTFQDIPVEDDQETTEKHDDEEKYESDSDSIDEVSLKDAELDLTDDEKEERRTIAEGLKVAGNDAFKVSEYERSIEKYTEGLKICPLQFTQQRSVLYCNRSAAKIKLAKHKSAIRDCNKAIELDDKYIKAYLRRAHSYEATEKFDESLADYKKVLELDPGHREANIAVHRLPPLIEERNEKLKTEMLGKLKDLGNMILKPFGLSTNNFQLEQDPDSKGYKINFKQ
ncbi:unnamed protein product [Leptidea sinapis]|uniref:Uncharacterized protein n=1 Tax=Leptidea sinapis TaxID=189913 RepID=A0A5E4QNS0_9NEOP|nr:unnamed protein product [Leptidea sinapis]